MKNQDIHRRQDRIENNNSQVLIARRLVTDLHAALSRHDRLIALYHLQQSISGKCGDPSVMGFYLLEERLLPALVLRLHAVVQCSPAKGDETAQILHLMDVLLKLCPRHLQEQVSLDLNTHFFDFASAELLPQHRDCPLPHLLLMLSVLHSCSATASGSQQILESRVTLMRIISILRYDDISDACLLEALNIFKNISYFGENHRQYLASLHEFLSSLGSLSGRTVCESILERVSAILRNLAVAPECRKILTQSAGVLRSLIKMGTCFNHAVIKNSLKALICLAMEEKSCVTLLNHGNGQLVDVIKRLVRISHNHTSIRKRAIRLLRLLSKQKSIHLVAYDNDLLDLLSNVVKEDQHDEIRQEAIEAFTHCIAVVTSSAPNYKSLLNQLVEWINQRRISLEMFACVIKEQASFTENSSVLAEQTKIIDILSQIAANVDSPPMARYDACHSLWLLAKEKENQVKLMASHFIVGSLVRNAADFLDDLEEMDTSKSCRERAIETIVYLAQCRSNRRTMVSHDKLLQVLIQFASTTHDYRMKDQVKEVILWLVQEA
ncbi:hypothetical protein FisN_8Hh157 [Fistulifera solaris]|jgi:hypothetical protein|uniref:Condensin complex subunit 1 C-terminal domain-containing protein n=1 Tax=Fistulifera solaris TaxID=1519565 RepID=A0A1Z5JYP4_FISSO|nr:hypothetical protein FisN_8Hh157 [Fistulifera solaris]|eukprot:GAX18938.1 hypothetical protein FisN_8Hh157 [Fistulifera solaris]